MEQKPAEQNKANVQHNGAGNTEGQTKACEHPQLLMFFHSGFYSVSFGVTRFIPGNGACDYVCRRSLVIKLHFLSVLMPTLLIPILRTSSRTATTCLKSALPSLLIITFGSLTVDLSVWSFNGN